MGLRYSRCTDRNDALKFDAEVERRLAVAMRSVSSTTSSSEPLRYTATDTPRHAATIRSQYEDAKAYVAEWQAEKQHRSERTSLKSFIFEQLKGRDGKDLGRLYGLYKLAEDGDWDGQLSDYADVEDIYAQFEEDPDVHVPSEKIQAMVDRIGLEHWRRLQGMSKEGAMKEYIHLVELIMKENNNRRKSPRRRHKAGSASPSKARGAVQQARAPEASAEPAATPPTTATAKSVDKRGKLQQAKSNDAASQQAPPTQLKIVYLPKAVKDPKRGMVVVLVETANNMWRATNDLLKAEATGIGYRSSKDLKDLVKGSGMSLKWGKCSQGFDEGDGWVRFPLPGDKASVGQGGA